MNTDDLIESLAEGVEPVSPLARPGRRALTWSLGAALYVTVLVVGMSVSREAGGNAGAPFWWSQIAAILTSFVASWAALASVVPGSSQQPRAWAALAAVVWVGTLLAAPGGADWAAISTASHEWLCVGFIVIGGAPLAAVLVVMLRRGAPLEPATTAALAALAAATIANVGACVSLPHADGAVTFAWHGGVVLALVVLGALTGRLVFGWHAVRGLPIGDRRAPRD